MVSGRHFDGNWHAQVTRAPDHAREMSEVAEIRRQRWLIDNKPAAGSANPSGGPSAAGSGEPMDDRWAAGPNDPSAAQSGAPSASGSDVPSADGSGVPPATGSGVPSAARPRVPPAASHWPDHSDVAQQDLVQGFLKATHEAIMRALDEVRLQAWRHCERVSESWSEGAREEGGAETRRESQREIERER